MITAKLDHLGACCSEIAKPAKVGSQGIRPRLPSLWAALKFQALLAARTRQAHVELGLEE
jgi:hypothetical protein